MEYSENIIMEDIQFTVPSNVRFYSLLSVRWSNIYAWQR